jgi:hypothetical protein
MSIHQHATLEDTVYFWFGSNDTSGSGDDGAAAATDVRLAGAAAGAAPVLSPAPTLLSHVNYPDGCYEVAVAATAANGFAATNTYAVFCTLTVDAQNPTGFVGSFTLDPIISNVREISDDATAATNAEAFFDGTGYAGTNNVIPTVTTLTGHTAQTGDSFTRLGAPAGASVSVDIAAVKTDTGNIETDTQNIQGRIPAALVGGRIDANAGAISGDATAADNLEAACDGGSYNVGGGAVVAASVTGAVGSVTGAVGSVTGNVGGSVASVVARVTANTDQIEGLDATDQIRDAVLDDATRFSGANVDAAISTRATPAQVNTEVTDVLTVDTFAEPGQEAPAATNTLAVKLGYLFKAFRNRITQTATTLSIYDDAGTTIDQKATVSDNGTTFDRGEIGTGP